MSKKDWKLLQAYQATGLSPEAVAQMQRKNRQLEQSYDAMYRDLKKALDKIESMRDGGAAVVAD